MTYIAAGGALNSTITHSLVLSISRTWRRVMTMTSYRHFISCIDSPYCCYVQYILMRWLEKIT